MEPKRRQQWFGPYPLTNPASFKRLRNFIDLCKKAMKYSSGAAQEKAAKKIERIILDEALIIPLWNVPAAVTYHHPWLHTTWILNGFMQWAPYY